MPTVASSDLGCSRLYSASGFSSCCFLGSIMGSEILIDLEYEQLILLTLVVYSRSIYAIAYLVQICCTVAITAYLYNSDNYSMIIVCVRVSMELAD